MQAAAISTASANRSRPSCRRTARPTSRKPSRDASVTHRSYLRSNASSCTTRWVRHSAPIWDVRRYRTTTVIRFRVSAPNPRSSATTDASPPRLIRRSVRISDAQRWDRAGNASRRRVRSRIPLGNRRSVSGVANARRPRISIRRVRPTVMSSFRFRRDLHRSASISVAAGWRNTTASSSRIKGSVIAYAIQSYRAPI